MIFDIIYPMTCSLKFHLYNIVHETSFYKYNFSSPFTKCGIKVIFLQKQTFVKPKETKISYISITRRYDLIDVEIWKIMELFSAF